MRNHIPAALPAADPEQGPTAPTSPAMPSIVDPTVQAADAWLRRFQAALVSIMAAAALGVGAVAFFTSFEAIRSYAKTSNGIAAEHSWAIPLLVDSFIVIATCAELWLGVHPAKRAWWEWGLVWPRVVLAGAATVSFVLNVAHAKAGDWPARGVAAIPPAALVLSVELLVLIARRAALARTHRLTTARQHDLEKATVVVRSDQATTRMVASTGGRPVLEATNRPSDQPTSPSGDHQDATGYPGDHQEATSVAGDQPDEAAGDQAWAATTRKTTSTKATGGATYQRVRELYVGGMTVAAQIARELGVSSSYAQRTLRRVKADLADHHDTPASGSARATTPERPAQATSDPEGDRAEVAVRSHDHLTMPNPQRGGRAEATRDGDGRATTTNPDRHLSLVVPSRDQDHGRGEVER